MHNTVEVCRYLFILLIIPLRIANNDWQWIIASVAVILNGLRLFHYATVLPLVNFPQLYIIEQNHDQTLVIMKHTF